MIIKDIKIVDGFYKNPDKVREMALNAEYKNFGNIQNFPGSESKKSFYSNRIKERFETLVENSITVSPEKYIFGKFRFSTKYDFAQTEVHLDYGIDWTGIVYLTKDQDSKGGLGIYRNRILDLEKVPTEEELKIFHCHDIREFDSKYIYTNSKLKDAWELIYEIPIKYNRLVLFKGCNYFHGITEQFGETIENSRLTQNFFFQEER